MKKNAFFIFFFEPYKISSKVSWHPIHKIDSDSTDFPQEKLRTESQNLAGSGLGPCRNNKIIKVPLFTSPCGKRSCWTFTTSNYYTFLLYSTVVHSGCVFLPIMWQLLAEQQNIFRPRTWWKRCCCEPKQCPALQTFGFHVLTFGVLRGWLQHCLIMFLSTQTTPFRGRLPIDILLNR